MVDVHAQIDAPDEKGVSLLLLRVAALYQRITIVTERVAAVAERKDAVDGGAKRNEQVKKVCKSKRACYCRGSRVAEIDQ